MAGVIAEASAGKVRVAARTQGYFKMTPRSNRHSMQS
jgi:hypothetical protein